MVEIVCSVEFPLIPPLVAAEVGIPVVAVAAEEEVGTGNADWSRGWRR